MTTEEKAKAVTRLYGNKDFQELILEEFVDKGIHNLVMTENVDSEGIRDLLKARKILHDWLYDIIQEAEIKKAEESL